MQAEPFRTLSAANDSYRFDCPEYVDEAGGRYCVGGDATSSVTVLALGDSHASQWFTALSTAASDVGVRVLLRQAAACSAIGPVGYDDSVEERDCRRFERESLQLMTALQPAAVIIADANASRLKAHPSSQDWAESTRSAVRLHASEARIGLIVDNPTSRDPLVCLARGRSQRECAPDPDVALAISRKFAAAESSLVRDRTLTAVLDVNRNLCDERSCVLQRQGAWTFAASGHITRAFTLQHLEDVRVLLRRPLA